MNTDVKSSNLQRRA